MMMFPVYDHTQQQQSCYYYSDPTMPCQQFPPLSPPIAPSPQVDLFVMCDIS